MKIQPNAFWMYPLQAIQFQNFLCVLDLLIICSSLQYISFCPDLYLLATFSAVLATIVSRLVFFTSFFICVSAMFGAMTSEPEGTCYASTYDSASQQYLALQRSRSNPQHTCRIYPCLNLLEWPLNVRCMNLFLPPFSSPFKVIRRHDDPSQAEGGGPKQSDTYQDITLQGGQ